MCLKQFWKKEKYMKRIAEGGLAHFRIWIISAVLPIDDLQPFIDEVVPKKENESGIDFQKIII